MRKISISQLQNAARQIKTLESLVRNNNKLAKIIRKEYHIEFKQQIFNNNYQEFSLFLDTYLYRISEIFLREGEDER